jgi:hypothetical protein
LRDAALLTALGHGPAIKTGRPTAYGLTLKRDRPPIGGRSRLAGSQSKSGD